MGYSQFGVKLVILRYRELLYGVMRGGEGNETTSRLTMVEEDVPAFPTPLTVKVWCSLISQLYPSYIISQPNALFSPLYLPSQGKQPLLMGKDVSLAPSGIGGTP